MRILIFHGYLLRGTGSNIYNASLVRALARLGHEVDLLCQERNWDAPEGVTVHNPDIGRVLPVYVADRYEGFEAKPYAELTDAELEHYLASNVAAVQDAPTPDVGLANHLVIGPAILAPGLAGRAPYAVKVHGSALEYTVRPHRARFLPYALEGVRGSAGVLVGSRHTGESLWEVLADEPALPERTRLGPPGVDVHSFKPGSANLPHLAARVGSADTASWGGEAGAAEALLSLDPSTDRIVSYVGKLIVSKGVDLLLAAWPLVVARVPEARLVIVGFGTYREALGRYVDALRREDLPDLLPACEAQVMSSTFPEAFGMVAAEAAACGALPLSANHSGMAEVTATLAPALPLELRPLMSFEVGPGAVREIAEKLVTWLTLDPQKREQARDALAADAARQYSWESVAEGVIEAASSPFSG